MQCANMQICIWVKWYFYRCTLNNNPCPEVCHQLNIYGCWGVVAMQVDTYEDTSYHGVWCIGVWMVMYGMDWLTVRQEAVLVKSCMWWKFGFQYLSINKWNVKEKFINILNFRDIAWLCLSIKFINYPSFLFRCRSIQKIVNEKHFTSFIELGFIIYYLNNISQLRMSSSIRSCNMFASSNRLLKMVNFEWTMNWKLPESIKV